mgnify:FL=1
MQGCLVCIYEKTLENSSFECIVNFSKYLSIMLLFACLAFMTTIINKTEVNTTAFNTSANNTMLS